MTPVSLLSQSYDYPHFPRLFGIYVIGVSGRGPSGRIISRTEGCGRNSGDSPMMTVTRNELENVTNPSCCGQ